MNWTNEQNLAISQRNKNIIVSAAAGSGKTAVLVERIRRIVVEEAVPLDRLLVVTFTNAAAAEMKEKIRKSLIAELENSQSNASSIKEQLDRLPMSYISTFHAFALRVIRRFFYLADIPAKFKICDDEKGHLLREEAMDVVIEEALSTDNDEIFDFFDCYSSDRNFDKIRNIIDDLHRKVTSHPERFDILDSFITQMSLDKDKAKESTMGAQLNRIIKEKLKLAEVSCRGAVELLKASGLDRMADSVYKCDYALIAELCEYEDIISNFNDIRAALGGYKPVVLRARKDEKESYEAIKFAVKNLRDESKEITSGIYNDYFTDSFDDALSYINKTAIPAKVLAELTRRYDEEFTERKRQLHLLDFNDIEYLCLSILKNEDARNYYRDKFEYILVDEFQDTNMLQDNIIKILEKNENLFMVGDVKQSIYKFRLAEPEIFQKRYELYSNPQQLESLSIDLNKNYRSKQPVIDCINNLFFNIMPGYDDKAALYCGLPYNGPYNYSVKFDVINTAKSSGFDAEVSPEMLQEADLFIETLSGIEIEALHVASIIKEHIGKPIWDSKKQAVRNIEPRDIVILLRNVKGKAQVYYNAVKNVGVDITIDDIGGYFDNLEIDTFINLLSIIDNKKQDIPLISVLHSDIFGFSAGELAEIRKEHLTDKFYDAFVSYEKDNELAQKCKYVSDCLKEWKNLSKVMPLDDFIWKIMLDTGHYLSMGAMPLGNQRQMNLKLLVEKAKAFSESNQSGLFGFLAHLKNLKMKKFDVAQSSGLDDSENAVKIMTIHKSKGLEFPMVILANMSARLKYTKSRSGIIFQKDVGLGMTYVDRKGCWKKMTVLEKVIEDAINLDEIEEEKRILYVAMTRAKDILYMVGRSLSCDRLQKNAEMKVYDVKSYLEMAAAFVPFRVLRIDAGGHVISDGGELQTPKEQLLSDDIYISNPDKKCVENILSRLNFEYPYKYSRDIKSRYSVSELNSRKRKDVSNQDALEEIEQYANICIPAFASQEHIYSAAEIGTLYHSVMEYIDFAGVAEDFRQYIDDVVECMVERGLVLKEEAALIDKTKIAGFFSTDLGKRAVTAAKAGNLRKEHSFTMIVSEYGEEFTVQGIIDCYFIENDEIVLLDYKTNRIRKGESAKEAEERLRETYKNQMQLYKTALEKATGKKVKESYLFLASAGLTVEC